MSWFRAQVRNGRLVLDERTDLPEGTVVDLVPADSADALDEVERRALHEALQRSAEDAQAGRTVDAKDLLDRLRTRK